MVVNEDDVPFRTFESMTEWEAYNAKHQEEHEAKKERNSAHPDGPCWRCCPVCGPEFKVAVLGGGG